jgi:hypothetical protein
MMKVARFLAMCAISVAFATFSIAWAQTYTSYDYPGAVATILDGGPNPQGTIAGSETDTSGVTHGFTLTSKGVATPQTTSTRKELSWALTTTQAT